MRLGIMQPYFFPYWGHFALIDRCDAWVVFDITQYTPKSWMSRNRILHPDQGWNWIQVPLANGSIHIRTSEARVLDAEAALRSILGKMAHYRRRAPYFRAVTDMVREAFAEAGHSGSLTQLNVAALKAVCLRLAIPFEPLVCSKLSLDLPPGLGAGDWALEIADRMGASHYLNPVSGAALFDPASFAERGIELQFLRTDGWTYETPGRDVQADLSILDAMMWNPATSVRQALRDHARIETPAVAAPAA